MPRRGQLYEISGLHAGRIKIATEIGESDLELFDGIIVGHSAVVPGFPNIKAIHLPL